MAMNVFTLLTAYCIVIMAVSIAGGRLTSFLRMTHLKTQLLMSGVGGLMLGIALLHLLPHGAEILNSPTRAGMGALIGLAIMFLLVRLFHSHDHCVPGVPGLDEPHVATALLLQSTGCRQTDHHDGTQCQLDRRDSVRGIGWAGLFLGLLLHTLVDGIALSASVIAENEHGAWLGLGGLGTFLAVALHKPLDAFAITTVMNRQNWSTRAQWIANVTFSLACPVGALAFYLGVNGLLSQTELLGWGLAISAGFFLGIALADLLPEVAFHDHDRGKLAATFMIGILLSIAVENLPGHTHAAGGESPPSESDAHEGHDHSH